MKKEKDVKISRKLILVIVLLLAALGCLSYYFIFNLDIFNILPENVGEKIDWSSIEYDDDFFPSDTVETYGEYGEWKFRDFRPIYAGYGITKDGLNYLIGKYLDEDGKEQMVKILVSGEGIPEYPLVNTDYLDFYNYYYKDYIAIRGEEWDPVEEKGTSDIDYPDDTVFERMERKYIYGCPEDIVFNYEEIEDMVDNETMDDIEYFFVDESLVDEYCNFYSMYYDRTDWSSLLREFDVVAKEILEIGNQITVRYMETDKGFEDCKYEATSVESLFCANEYLNEEFEDYIVGVYIEL